MNTHAEDLYNAAQELLAAAAESIEADSPGGRIDYQAVWTGPPAFDCAPALLVTVGAVTLADTLNGGGGLALYQRMVGSGQVNLEAFAITMLRCVTGIGQDGDTIYLPSPAQVNEDSRICYGDLWACWNGVKNKHLAKTLFQTPSGRREMSIGPAIPIRQEGGVGGWVLNVAANIPGYAVEETP